MAKQIVRVAITEVDTETGILATRSLTGEDAKRWHDMSQTVSVIAHTHGVNPDFASLKWQTEPGMLVKEAAQKGSDD